MIDYSAESVDYNCRYSDAVFQDCGGREENLNSRRIEDSLNSKRIEDGFWQNHIQKYLGKMAFGEIRFKNIQEYLGKMDYEKIQ